MSAPKWQHKLPRSYLGRFCDPSQPGHVWLHRPGEAPLKTGKNQQPFAEDLFYTYTDDQGERHQDVERFLARIEGDAARVFTREIALRLRLPHRERWDLALFVGFLAVRTVAYRQALDTRHNALTPQDRESILSLTPPDELRLVSDLLDSATPGRNLHLHRMLVVGLQIARVAFKKRWRFLHTGNDRPFHTSDSPFAADRRRRHGWGFEDKDIRIFTPLASTVLLELSSPSAPNVKHVTATSLQVMEANTWLAEQACEYVISCQENPKLPGRYCLGAIDAI